MKLQELMIKHLDNAMEPIYSQVIMSKLTNTRYEDKTYYWYNSDVFDSFVMVKEFIENLNFIDDTSIVRNCLTEYNVFCDREDFYYDKETLNFYNEEELLQILFCEIYNSMQRPLKQYVKSEKAYLSHNLLFLYHIKVHENRLAFAQNGRQYLIDIYKDKYPNSKIINFCHNKHANDFIRDKILSNYRNNNKQDKTCEIAYWFMKKQCIDIRTERYNL